MNTEIKKFLSECVFKDGASEIEIEKLTSTITEPLPKEYLQLLAISNGLGGFVGDEYLMLYDVKTVLESYAQPDYFEYYEDYAPGVIVIGSNGGGENFGIVTSKNPIEFIVAPSIGGEKEDVIILGNSMLGFLEALKRGIFEGL